MIDVRGVAPRHFPAFAHNLRGRRRHHQHGGHAERVRHFEIARQVLEQRGARRVDAVAGEETVIDLRLRLGIEERLMRETFGEAYDAYARRVKALVPFVI